MSVLAPLILSLFFIREPKCDLDFRFAVEEFVIAASATRRAPEPYGSLIAGCGLPCFTCRQIYARKLTKLSLYSDDRWLFWATKHRDPEVRMRANAILRRIHICWRCLGSGVCLEYEGEGQSLYSRQYCRNCGFAEWRHKSESYSNYCMCRTCDGFGTQWSK